MLASRAHTMPRTPEELLPPELAGAIERLDLTSRQVLGGTMPGERRSKRRGRSVEFDDFRAYLPGDDLRHIDWNVYARLDRLVVKLFREEEDLSLTIALDLSASMDAGEPNKAVFGARLAASLAYLALVNHNRVRVGVFGVGGGLEMPGPRRGRGEVREVVRFLLGSLNAPRAGAASGGDVAGAMRALGSLRASRGVVVVISDFLIPAGEESALAYLSPTPGSPRDVYCVQVLAPGELEPAKEQARGLVGDLRLVDSERGESAAADVTVTPESIARYKAGFAGWREELRRACSSRGLAHVLVPTDSPMAPLLAGAMRRGGMLR